MTVVECFDRDPIENISSCLSLKPDTLIFIGDIDIMQKRVNRYKQFFKNKGINTKIVLRSVNSDDINDAVFVLTDIIKSGDNCVIDISGGNEAVIAAAGIVYDRQKENYPVIIQQLDTESGSFTYSDGHIEKGSSPEITVKELIYLYGGVVSPLKPQPDSKYSIKDIAPLWSIVARDAHSWNKKVAVLSEIEHHSGAKSDDLHISVNFNSIKSNIDNFVYKRTVFESVMRSLSACGAVKVHSSKEEDYRYSYKNSLICSCLNGSGNMLEYKTLFEARSLRQNGTPFFCDCFMGVNIDWDGIVHDIASPIKDTKNEIDCILMHGLTPLFVSCKNGKIGESELYKLNTVAERFGGKHAKKLLIATNFFADSENSKRSVIQRAADMGILFEPNAAALDEKGWQKLLTGAIK